MELKELSSFISDLRKHTPQQSFRAKIQKELGSIKKLFLSGKLSSSDVKVPIAKLAYFAVNGFEIDFGETQVITLLNSHKLSNIRIGYLAASLLFQHESMSFSSIIPILKQHLTAYTNDSLQSVALSFTSSIFDEKQINEIAPFVAELVVCQTASEYTRKKAMLFLARVAHKTRFSGIIDLISPALEVYFVKKSNLRIAASTLVLSLMTMNPHLFPNIFDKALEQLVKLFVEQSEGDDVMYYGTPSPWYARQLMRILRLKITWSDSNKKLLESVSLAIFSRTGEIVPLRKAYSYLMVLYELMSVVAMVPLSIDSMKLCAECVAKHLNTDRVNILSFALESVMRLVQTTPSLVAIISTNNTKQYLFNAMRNADISVAKVAVALIEKIGCLENCHEIVDEVMSYLPAAPLEMRKVLCGTVIKLVTEFAIEPSFFVTTMISLMMNTGDFCDENIFPVTAQKIATFEALRKPAMDQMLTFIYNTPDPSEPLMKLAVYVCGEYATGQKDLKLILDLFQNRFGVSSPIVQAMIVTAVTKICTRNPDILNQSLNFLGTIISSPYHEVSQRASEAFLVLTNTPRSKNIYSSIPQGFTEDDCNELLDRIEDIFNGINQSSNEVTVSQFNPDQVIPQEEEDKSDNETESSDEEENGEEEDEESNIEKNEQMKEHEKAHRKILELIESIRDRFSKVDRGKIYQDKLLTVYALVKYSEKGAEILLHLTNTAISPMDNIKFHLQQTPAFQSILYSKVETNLLPNCSFKVPILVKKLADFEELPQVAIEFALGATQSHVITIFLPALSSSFV